MNVAITACETGMARMYEALAPGMTENELWAILHETNIATQVEREDAALVRAFQTEDFREGATAWWIDKRKPVFVGR